MATEEKTEEQKASLPDTWPENTDIAKESAEREITEAESAGRKIPAGKSTEDVLAEKAIKENKIAEKESTEKRA